MYGDVHDPVVVIELSLGALAMMHVPVHYQDPLYTGLQSFTSAQSDVIEIAVTTSLEAIKMFWWL